MVLSFQFKTNVLVRRYKQPEFRGKGYSHAVLRSVLAPQVDGRAHQCAIGVVYDNAGHYSSFRPDSRVDLDDRRRRTQSDQWNPSIAVELKGHARIALLVLHG